MRRTGTILAAQLLLILCFATVGLPARENRVELGGTHGWADRLVSAANLDLASGRRDMQQLVLRQGGYLAGPDTELYIDFDTSGFRDDTGNYTVTGREEGTESHGYRGAAAVFRGSQDGLLLHSRRAGMFSPGAVWDDFTIEFYLYPAALSDREQILHWRGSLGNGADAVAQQLIVEVRNRSLVFRFDNMFFSPDGTPLKLEVPGRDGLIPRRWNHHMLRYDADTGLLEYLVDEVPQEVLHMTSSGTESGDTARVRIGSGSSAELLVGSRFTGFMDELRVERSFVDAPSRAALVNGNGLAVSRVIDLGRSTARLSRIDAEYATPGATDIFFEYRIGENRVGMDAVDAEWARFTPNQDMESMPRGRYLQVRAELFADGDLERTPSITSISPVYESPPPPAPPVRVMAEAQDGAVRLQWSPVLDPEIEGYVVYYGTQSGRYFSGDSDLGLSPLDVGRTTDIEITGLENGRLYYFAVAAYDRAGPVYETVPSREVNARPTRHAR